MKELKLFFETIRKLGNEFLGIILALIIFACSPYLFRLFDPTAGAYDFGVLQIPIFSIVSVLIFSFLSWIGLKVNFPAIFDYLQIELFSDFKTLDKWQKTKISLLLYFGYLALLVFMARAL